VDKDTVGLRRLLRTVGSYRAGKEKDSGGDLGEGYKIPRPKKANHRSTGDRVNSQKFPRARSPGLKGSREKKGGEKKTKALKEKIKGQ